MEKFWQVKNEADDSAELILYGPISETSWFDDDVTPMAFAEDLKAIGGKDLTVRVNSPGGDVFAAQAIYNLLKCYKGKVTMRIDGLAASAATIITCAGDTVIMPGNALFMIHNPMSFSSGSAKDLREAADVLDKVRDTIVNVYAERCGDSLSDTKIKHMMDDETWMTAQEALDNGFIDEIDSSMVVEDCIKGNQLIINSCAFDLSNFQKIDKIKSLLGEKPPENAKKEDHTMNDNNLLQKIAAKLGISENQEPAEPQMTADEAVAAERKRVADLEAMKMAGDAIVDSIINSIIDTAKAEGETAEAISKYVDAAKKAQEEAPAPAAVAAIKNIVEDQKSSGAEDVAPSVPKTTDEERAAIIDQVVKLANKERG